MNVLILEGILNALPDEFSKLCAYDQVHYLLEKDLPLGEYFALWVKETAPLLVEPLSRVLFTAKGNRETLSEGFIKQQVVVMSHELAQDKPCAIIRMWHDEKEQKRASVVVVDINIDRISFASLLVDNNRVGVLQIAGTIFKDQKEIRYFNPITGEDCSINEESEKVISGIVTFVQQFSDFFFSFASSTVFKEGLKAIKERIDQNRV